MTAAVAAACASGVHTSQAGDDEGDSTRQEAECARLLDRVESGEREYADYLAADTIPSECVPEAVRRGVLHEGRR